MKKIAIVTPIYNDWTCFAHLLRDIDSCLSTENIFAEVWAVDDFSSQPMEFSLRDSLVSISKINLISLSRNLGHQRAIAIGLSHIVKNAQYDAVIVMDSDGEDRPTDIIGLLKEAALYNDNIIFARRGKRSESFLFRFFYRVYQRFFYYLTGNQVFTGNFCLIPFERLKQIVTLSEIWNHFSAGIHKAKFPCRYVLCERGNRYNGQSKMNFVSLVLHGLSSISVYSEVVGTRIILGSTFLQVLITFLSIVVVVIRLFSNIPVPGWATYTIGLLLTLFFQLFTITLVFSFLILNQRSGFMFIPIRDYQLFIGETKILYPEIK